MKFFKLSKLILFSIGLTFFTFDTAIYSYGYKKFNPVEASQYNIHQVKNLDLLKDQIPSLDQDSLVLFDIDHTIIVFAPVKPIWKPLAGNYSLIKRLFEDVPQDRVAKLLAQAAKSLKVELIDEELPSIIRKIQHNGVKTIALTARAAREVKELKIFTQDKLFKELKSLGIDFRKSFPKYKSFKLDHLKKGELVPVYYKGIMLSAPASKGDTLKAFLKKVNWSPKRIILIDDMYDNLLSVGQASRDLKIPFLGLHYLAGQELPWNDPKVAEAQVSYLIRHGKWISADEAQNIMKLNKR